jgi:hypothetical protein
VEVTRQLVVGGWRVRERHRAMTAEIDDAENLDALLDRG